MKRTHKGFTLVELLIVVAIIGVLGAMMTMSSTESVDSAGANAILSNLQSMKVAAMSMYMEQPKVASLTSITFDGKSRIGEDTRTEADKTDETKDTREKVGDILAKYLGKKADTLVKTDTKANKYGLVGDKDNWFVVYILDTKDSKGLKAKLKDKAAASDLYGAKATTAGAPVIGDFTASTVTYYAQDAVTTTHDCVALRVR